MNYIESRKKHRSQQRKSLSLWLTMLTASGAILFFVPNNFVTLSPAWTAAVQLFAALGVGSSIALLARARPTPVVGLVAPLVLIVLLSGLASSAAVAASVTALPYVIGFAIGVAWVLAPAAMTPSLFVALCVIVGSIVLDAMLGFPASGYLFGEPHRITELTQTRSRGIIGQPVPAAFLSVAIGAMLYVGTWTKKGRLPTLYRAAAIVAPLSALLLTGTRSGLIVLAACVAWAVLTRPRSTPSPVRTLATLSGFALFSATVLAIYPQLATLLQGSRIADFEALEGSESLANRTYALEVLERWARECDPVCKLVGSGPRSLQLQLDLYFGLNGLKTIDNMYVTILWDFGVIGLALLVIALTLAARVSTRRDRSVAELAASVGVIAILTACFFSDALYITPILLLFGCCVGVLCQSNLTRKIVRSGNAV